MATLRTRNSSDNKCNTQVSHSLAEILIIVSNIFYSPYAWQFASKNDHAEVFSRIKLYLFFSRPNFFGQLWLHLNVKLKKLLSFLNLKQSLFRCLTSSVVDKVTRALLLNLGCQRGGKIFVPFPR